MKTVKYQNHKRTLNTRLILGIVVGLIVVAIIGSRSPSGSATRMAPGQKITLGSVLLARWPAVG